MEWSTVTRYLRRFAGGQDGEDDVQETLMRLVQRLGPEASLTDCVRLGRFILRRCRIDRQRRRSMILLGDEAYQLPAEPLPLRARSTSRLALRHDLVMELGPGGARLLTLLLSGVRGNKAMARILDTSPCAVRRRRQRIRRTLESILAEPGRTCGDDPPDPVPSEETHPWPPSPSQGPQETR